jgi:hypothetical protein
LKLSEIKKTRVHIRGVYINKKNNCNLKERICDEIYESGDFNYGDYNVNDRINRM